MMTLRTCALSLLTIALCSLHLQAPAQTDARGRQAYLGPLVAAERGVADLPPESLSGVRTPALQALMLPAGEFRCAYED